MRRSATAAAGLHEQRRVFVLIYAAYVGLLVARKNYGFWIPHAMAVLSLEKKDVAVIGSSFEMASGYGALLNGFLIDTFDPALGLAAALGLSALVNACLARASSLETMALLWGVNGVAQSFGWPCVSRLFLRAFPEPKGRGLWYSLLSTSQNVGAALVPILVTAASAATADARAAFLLPAALSAALCVTLLCTLTPMRDAPAPAAPAPPADHSPPSSPPPSSPLAAPSSAWAELGGVLGNWRLWVMAADYFTIGIVRSCLTDWTPMYLAEEKGLGVAAASRCLCVFELGGFLGSIAAGRLSDRACGGRRGPVIASCTVLLCPALLALGALRGEPALLAIYFALGALAFPVHVLLGLASREIVSPTASSTAGGLVKFVAQMGASSAGYPLGLLQRAHGWQAVLALLSALSCAGGLVASSLWLTVARVDEERAAARSGQQLHKRKGG
jgi:OPA family sugar phosphate sensor protein UhpC-like MFS transporter